MITNCKLDLFTWSYSDCTNAQNWEMILIRTLEEAVASNLRLVRQNLI